MHIIHVASEATPFIKTGGLADVIGELSKNQAKKGLTVSVILPKYSKINECFTKEFIFCKHFDVYLGTGRQYCGVYKYFYEGVNFYFLDNEKYFRRDNIYGYDDEGERFGYFSVAALEVMAHLQLQPNIVHCHDWQTGMVSVMYHEHYKNYPFFENYRFIYTIHNPMFQGNYPRNILGGVFMLSDDIFNNGKIRFKNMVSYLKAGLIYCDIITTVSKSYKEELCTWEGGCGLENIFSYRYQDFYGIVNGIDYELNDPLQDKALSTNYSFKNISKKAENKLALQKQYNLKIDKNIPLFAMVTRLTSQKGIDLLLQIGDELLSKDVQLIVIGTGDFHYEYHLQTLRDKFGDKMIVYFGYQADLAKMAYAASDFFLMPSLFEPCGISQLIAMRYGSLPIVREVGGLKDTVTPYNEYTLKGTGFSFMEYTSIDFMNCINYALYIYQFKHHMKAMVTQAMKADFSWHQAMNEYQKLYELVLKR